MSLCFMTKSLIPYTNILDDWNCCNWPLDINVSNKLATLFGDKLWWENILVNIKFSTGWKYTSHWPQLLWRYLCPYEHARWCKFKVWPIPIFSIFHLSLTLTHARKLASKRTLYKKSFDFFFFSNFKEAVSCQYCKGKFLFGLCSQGYFFSFGLCSRIWITFIILWIFCI